MATIQVRDVPDEVAETFRRRAVVAGQSLQVYMRELLIKTALRPDKAELMALVERALENDPGPGLDGETIRSLLEEARGGE
ncbi:MAG: antitoxin [Saccharothrix sp.]|nr:antitoxin [Saccharothrix sp.]